MYVLCVGMYRACSTWQYDVAADLLERHRAGERLGYMTGEEFAAYDDSHGRPVHDWKIVKSHEGHPRFRAVIAEGRAIALYSHRDLRDVVYSLMHKRRVDFETLLTQGMIHQLLANDRFWTRRPHILIQRYEELVSNPTDAIRQIARFLGLSPRADEVAELATLYSHQANQRRIRALEARLRELGLNLDDPRNAQHADHRTLLHWNHLRDGRSGSWVESATPRERAILTAVGGRWMRDHSYTIETDSDVTPRPSLCDRIRDFRSILRGWLACRLRCCALNHPGTAARLRRWLGIAPPPHPHVNSVAIRVGQPTIAQRNEAA